jgi:hypothetical protein
VGPVVVMFWDVCVVLHGIVMEDNVPLARRRVMVEFRNTGYARTLHFDVGQGLETSADDTGGTRGAVCVFRSLPNAEELRNRQNVAGDVAYRTDEAPNRLAPDNGDRNQRMMNECCAR